MDQYFLFHEASLKIIPTGLSFLELLSIILLPLSDEEAQGSMTSDEEAQTDYLNFIIISYETCWFIILIWSHQFFFCEYLANIFCHDVFLATWETAKELATLLILSKWDVLMKSSLVALVGPTNREPQSWLYPLRTPSLTYTKKDTINETVNTFCIWIIRLFRPLRELDELNMYQTIVIDAFNTQTVLLVYVVLWCAALCCSVLLSNSY